MLSKTAIFRAARNFRFLVLVPVILGGVLFAQSCSTAELTEQRLRVRGISFNEIWGYLMKGEEKAVRGDEPLTDLCYFCASVAPTGRMKGTCLRPQIPWKGKTPPRVHMVVAVLNNPALMRKCLDPASPVRDLLLKDIVKAAEPFNGVQIDFESLPASETVPYVAFLTELRARLKPGTILSAAIPARRKRGNDAYDYGAIAAVVDRVVVMAYDQHWKTSPPGPVASLPWCREVLQYARSAVPLEKLIMGLPLYARAWQDNNVHRSLKYHEVREILKQTGIRPQYEKDKGLFFQYQDTATVKVFFDSRKTLMDKLRMYRAEGVRAVSFWRMGQGPDTLWPLLLLRQHKSGL